VEKWERILGNLCVCVSLCVHVCTDIGLADRLVCWNLFMSNILKVNVGSCVKRHGGSGDIASAGLTKVLHGGKQFASDCYHFIFMERASQVHQISTWLCSRVILDVIMKWEIFGLTGNLTLAIQPTGCHVSNSTTPFTGCASHVHSPADWS
jgi:hypothetical protein